MPQSNPIVSLITKAARRYGIPTGLLYGLVKNESGFRPSVVSPAGAVGLTQLMPATARGLHVDPYNAAQNIDGGARYLRAQYDRFGNWKLALAAYNAGPGAVQKYGGVPPYAETQRYVNNILGYQKSGGGLAVPTPAQPPLGSAQPAAGVPATRTVPAFNPVVIAALQANANIIGVQAPDFSMFTKTETVRPSAPAAAASSPPSPTATGKPFKYKRGKTITFLEHFADPYGVQITSTTEGNHVKGSYHYRGRAVDFGGPSSNLASLANAALQHPQDFTEMFYTGPGNPGFYIKNGQVYPNKQLDKSVAANHHDHVHLAR